MAIAERDGDGDPSFGGDDLHPADEGTGEAQQHDGRENVDGAERSDLGLVPDEERSEVVLGRERRRESSGGQHA
jgi:hypothetical protein